MLPNFNLRQYVAWLFIAMMISFLMTPAFAVGETSDDLTTQNSTPMDQQEAKTTGDTGEATPEDKPSGSITAQTILANIAKQVPQLIKMVTAAAYVIGIYLLIAGVIKLKHIGEMRSMSSQEKHLSAPIAMIVVGALLLYLPTTVDIATGTFWEGNPYGYVPPDQNQWTEAIKDIFLVVQLIGVIAVIRGLLLFSHMGSGGHQQGGITKGVTFVIAGIFCMNIYQLVKLIWATLGMKVNF